jgi:hypothetical protein
MGKALDRVLMAMLLHDSLGESLLTAGHQADMRAARRRPWLYHGSRYS